MKRLNNQILIMNNMQRLILFNGIAVSIFTLTTSMAPAGGGQSGPGYSGLLFPFLIIIGIIGFFAYKSRQKKKSTAASDNAVKVVESANTINKMFYPIIILALSAALYIGSVFLEKQARDLKSETYWGSGSQSSFKRAKTTLEISEYSYKGSIVLVIAGGLWLVVSAIGMSKK
jgi:Ca2+/Na+ antiporter